MDDFAVSPSETSAATARLGTRFLVFPQPSFIPGYERPEVVWLSAPAGAVEPGPADSRMYVVDPLTAKRPYEYPDLPPYTGAVHPPPEPGADGHFDHLAVGSRAFLAAHAYACSRRMLDICESYLGDEIPWFFAPTYERLEIVPHIPWDNAQSGYGYLEMGEDDARGAVQPFALNFDAVAHEIGHLILFGVLGLPRRRSPSREFFAYHEAIADFLSLIGLLHFDTALDRILRRAKGNLLIMNELDRFAELSDEKQVRMFNHALKIGDVGAEVHDFSKPFAGALFDSLIETYQVLLYERGLSDLDPREFRDLRSVLSQAEVERQLAAASDAYEGRHFAVKSALIEARDIIGGVLIRSWRVLDPDDLSFHDAAAAMIEVAETGRSRRFAGTVRDCFAWRGVM